MGKHILTRFGIVLFIVFYILEIAASAQVIVNPRQIERVAVWNFDEGQGEMIHDSTGNGNDGIISGGMWRADKNFGTTFEFDGVDDRVDIIKTDSVDLVHSMILEAVVKRTSIEDGMIISKNGPYFLAIRDNVVVGGVYTDNGGGEYTWTEARAAPSFRTLEEDVWYRLQLSYDGERISVAVGDGLENSLVVVGTALKNGRMPQVSQSVHLGWGELGHDQYFEGLISYASISEYSTTILFIRGDANGDELVDISDVSFILNYLFQGGQNPRCLDAADANDDGIIDVSDVVYLIRYLFIGSEEPPSPFGEAGRDPTWADGLSC